MTPQEIRNRRVLLKRAYRTLCIPARVWYDAEMAKLQAECDHEWEDNIYHEGKYRAQSCTLCHAWRRVVQP